MTHKDLESAISSIGIETLPPCLGDCRRALAEIFARQICDGQDRMVDPHFTNDRGHNVGRDVLLAASGGARQLKNLPDGSVTIALAMLLERLAEAKANFQSEQDDPDGYGAATFGELIKGVEAFADRFGSHQA